MPVNHFKNNQHQAFTAYRVTRSLLSEQVLMVHRQPEIYFPVGSISIKPYLIC